MGEGAIENQWGNQRKKRYFLNKRFPVKTKKFFYWNVSRKLEIKNAMIQREILIEEVLMKRNGWREIFNSVSSASKYLTNSTTKFFTIFVLGYKCY